MKRSIVDCSLMLKRSLKDSLRSDLWAHVTTLGFMAFLFPDLFYEPRVVGPHSSGDERESYRLHERSDRAITLTAHDNFLFIHLLMNFSCLNSLFF
jgi:hypothetical protein